VDQVSISLVPNGLLKASCRGYQVFVSFDKKRAEKTFSRIIKQFEEVGLQLTTEERVELLRQYNALLEGQLLPSIKEDQEKTDGLMFKDKDLLIELKADDGVVVSPASLFYKTLDQILIGEMFFSHAVVEKQTDDGPIKINTIEPVVLWALHNGAEVQRSWKPLRALEFIMVGERPVTIERPGYFKTTISTLMSMHAFQNFLNGAEPKSIKELFERVKSSWQQFVKFDWDPRLYDLASCWVIGTYFYDLFHTYPFLYFYGSQGTGKTRAGRTATMLARHGYIVTDPTEAVLYRIAQAIKPTLLIDEALLGPHAWKLTRAAFKKGFKVPRIEKTDKEGFWLEFFDIYMPIVFASTELPSELGGQDADEARAIIVNMQQAQDPIGRDPEPEDFADLRDDLYLYRLLSVDEVIKAFQEVKTQNLNLYGHEREVWLPIFTIASLCGVLDSVKEIAEELYELKSLSQYKEEKTLLNAVLLLRDFNKDQTKVAEGSKEDVLAFTPASLVEFVKQVLIEEGEYDERLFPKVWSPERIGRLLTKMNVYRRRVGRGKQYLLSCSQLENLCERYGVRNNENSVCSVGSVCNFERGVDKKIEDSDDKNSVNPSLKSHTQHTQHTQNHQIDDGSDGGLSVCSQSTDTQHTLPPVDLKGLEIPQNLDIEIRRLDPQDFVKTSCAYCNQETTIVAYLGSWPICYDCLRQQLEEAKKRWQS